MRKNDSSPPSILLLPPRSAGGGDSCSRDSDSIHSYKATRSSSLRAYSPEEMGAFVSPEAPAISDEEKKMVLGLNCSVAAIAKYIKDGRAKKVVVMCGAGISVSAGIPDFRTPGSGLYDNLQKYGLEKPELMFDIEFFKENAAPFYDLAKALFPTNFRPTPTHFFIKLLQEKGLLLRCYTQNIDTLERQAGIDPDLLVEAHGGFGSAHCTRCNAEYSQEYCREKIFTMSDGKTDADGNTIPWCLCDQPDCLGNVKPDIVFFGEPLPASFGTSREVDLPQADLLIVLGTSLKVYPFAATKDFCSSHAPRLLINLERVGVDDETEETSWSRNNFLFDKPNNWRDVELLSSCDEGVLMLCELVGWRSDLEALIRTQRPDWSWSPSEVEIDLNINLKDLLKQKRVTRNQRKSAAEEGEDTVTVDIPVYGLYPGDGNHDIVEKLGPIGAKTGVKNKTAPSSPPLKSSSTAAKATALVKGKVAADNKSSGATTANTTAATANTTKVTTSNSTTATNRASSIKKTRRSFESRTSSTGADATSTSSAATSTTKAGGCK